MGKYATDIKHTLTEQEVKAIYDNAKSETERVLISLLWLTGARPGELVLIYKNEIWLGIEDNKEIVRIFVKTLKKRKEGNFQQEKRMLPYLRTNGLNTNYYLEAIIDYAKKLNDGDRLLAYTTRWVEGVIHKRSIDALGIPLSPYHFRHSLFTWLARNGVDPATLAAFKGGTILSVQPYVTGSTQIMNFNAIKKSFTGTPIIGNMGGEAHV